MTDAGLETTSAAFTCFGRKAMNLVRRMKLRWKRKMKWLDGGKDQD
jgi:hypothetical protein